MELSAIRNTFNNGVELLATLEAEANLKDIQGLGEAFRRSACAGQFGMANVYAELVDLARLAYQRARANGPVNFPVTPAAPLFVNDGTYTLVYEGDRYFTFRIRIVKTGKLAGRRVVQYLSGPNNELDFQSFGFVNANSINVWSRFEKGDLVNRAREIEAVIRQDRDALEAAGFRYAEMSKRCRRCNKVLSVPASLGAGYGEECAKALGVPYGHVNDDVPAPAESDVIYEGEFDHLSDSELEEMAGRAELSGGRRGIRADLRASDRMYAELQRRRDIARVA